MRIKLPAVMLAFTFIGSTAQSAGTFCPRNDTGLKLPEGFCATVFADDLGHARHLTIGPNGVVYVNTWSGAYYGDRATRPEGFLIALQDETGSGKATVIRRFGATPATGGRGGTGIAFHKGALYAEINDRIVRYTLSPSEMVPRGKPEIVVSGLPLEGDHPMHPFAIDADGSMYVDVASASNSCQVKNRTLTSPGVNPCTELLTRGGVWRFDANQSNQKFSPARRYATGIRNAEGIAVDAGGGVYATQHGRDQLAENWPALYTPEQGATLPSEELLKLQAGSDFGWPECYFDPVQRKLVLAPEYGGDGGTKIGDCANKVPPVAAFPAHWAPNALLIYDATQFPQRYRHGAFIAFHGSWNRAPFPQGGYNLVYQTLNQGGAESRCEIFADGFAGAVKSPGKANHRPSGLAMSPQGDLYVSDDVSGRIYKITYQGNTGADRATTFVPCPSASASAGGIGTEPSNAVEASSESLPIAKGTTSEMVTLGNRIYHGQVGAATCVGCHGTEGTGTPLGPNLVDGDWLWGDGSLDAITNTIVAGVSKPRQYRNSMPPLGGAQLTNQQVAALAAYVWSASHRNANSATAQTTPPGEINIPGANVFPESITSTADGTMYIGGIGTRSVFRVNPQESRAKPWIALESDQSQGVFGVLADERSNTLWACVSPISNKQNKSESATLKAVDLRTGEIKAQFALPTAAPFCNDIAVGADGSVYVTDTNNMEIVRLGVRASRLAVWAGGGAFGPKGGVLDGIVVLQNRVIVNAQATNKLFAVPINQDGRSGPVTELKLDRAIHEPDGMRPFGNHALLMAESGGAGALSKVDIRANSGSVVTLKEGYPEGPVAVTLVGGTAYVLEGQLQTMFGHAEPRPVPKPFRATAFHVGNP